MNFDKLKELVVNGARIRLRPMAVHLNPQGDWEEVDYIWMIDSVSRKGGTKLSTSTTGDNIILFQDHVNHFTQDKPHADGFIHGFLEVEVRVKLRPRAPFELEPFLSGPARFLSPKRPQR
jgi:hypothetical protein